MYRIVAYPEAADQIAALPADALHSYADVLSVLELTPWNGSPLHEDNPDGAVRRWDFGPGQAGQAIYLVLDERQEVHVILVQWFGGPLASSRSPILTRDAPQGLTPAKVY